MTDAEELRDILKMYGARWQGSERATVRRIADRLEKIDAQEALKSGQDVPKIFIPLNYAQACADAGMPISWVVEEGKKP